MLFTHHLPMRNLRAKTFSTGSDLIITQIIEAKAAAKAAAEAEDDL